MSWTRGGDTAAHHPALLNVREHPEHDERLLHETYGYVLRCAALSAAHDTDYVVSRGTALELGGSRAEALIGVALFAGLFTDVVQLTGGRLAYKLIDDPTFLHLRTKAEKEWEAQRKRDSSNLALTVPVRLRDGDACRYCGNVVYFGDTRSARAGTYDHRCPGRAGTVDTVVVACKACNSGRRDDPDADIRYPLLPPPAQPFYHPKTVQWLTDKGHTVRVGSQPASAPTPRPGTQPDTAGTTTARPVIETDPARPRPGTRPDTAAAPARPAAADTAPAGSTDTPPGTSRNQQDGWVPKPAWPGRAGSGREPDRGRTRDQPQRRRRGRRGRRGGTANSGG